LAPYTPESGKKTEHYSPNEQEESNLDSQEMKQGNNMPEEEAI